MGVEASILRALLSFLPGDWCTSTVLSCALLPPIIELGPLFPSSVIQVGHFSVYGGTYYSYLYARCLSSALWDTYLAADPFDPCAGENHNTVSDTDLIT